MADTTLTDFSGVIVFALVLWFSGNIYLGLAFFALKQPTLKRPRFVRASAISRPFMMFE